MNRIRRSHLATRTFPSIDAFVDAVLGGFDHNAHVIAFNHHHYSEWTKRAAERVRGEGERIVAEYRARQKAYHAALAPIRAAERGETPPFWTQAAE